MTWGMHDGTGNTYNLSHTSGSDSFFRFKEVAKHHGWTVPISSDATTHTHGDVITKASSGAGGMDNNSAYFVIQDPGTNREYCYQRSTNSYTWAVIYSASAGFTGGDATNRPTATDEKGVISGSTSAAALFAASGSWNCQIAFNDAATNGVYPFWMICSVAGATTCYTVVATDAVTADSMGTGDTDPSVHIACNTAQISSITSDTGTTNMFYGWQLYSNAVNREWDTFTLFSLAGWSGTNFIPGVLSTNPEDTSYLKIAPVVGRVRSAAARKGGKGVLANTRWNHNPTATPYGNVLNDGTIVYLPTPYLAFPGWPDAGINPAV